VIGVTLFVSAGRHKAEKLSQTEATALTNNSSGSSIECGLAPDRIARTIVIDLYLMIARLAEQLAREEV
jgi:hypothetical protein